MSKRNFLRPNKLAIPFQFVIRDREPETCELMTFFTDAILNKKWKMQFIITPIIQILTQKVDKIKESRKLDEITSVVNLEILETPI